MTTTNDQHDDQPDGNLTEDVLREGGKTEEEIRRTGEFDRAEDEYERALPPKFRTENSPVHRMLWEGGVEEMFRVNHRQALNEPSRLAMQRSLEIVQRHMEAGTMYDPATNKVPDSILIGELGPAGYWGLMVDEKHGGSGAGVLAFMEYLTDMCAQGNPSVAGLNSIHQCIGAVDPFNGYGESSPQWRDEELPKLASGEHLSCFMLTEPGAGSDLTAVRTSYRRVEGGFMINGEKLFISNLKEGRTAGLVARSAENGKLDVFVIRLPEEQNDSFRLKPYGIHAVPHINNQGVVFTEFFVPEKCLLKVFDPVKKEWASGKGLQLAYHGLNRGRVAIGALGGGMMRRLLKSMLPWSEFRKTYGQPIQKRELVKRRIARVASLIVGADALRDWGASLLDEGYRGELECVIAKIFAADAMVETMIKSLKTHGGRSFLKGHIVGDYVHEYFAPSIYEGENEMLAMAFFKSLSKAKGTEYMGPLMKVFQEEEIGLTELQRKPVTGFAKLLATNPKAAFRIGKKAVPMAGWALKNELRGKGRGDVAGIHPSLQEHAKFARAEFAKLSRRIYRTMLTTGVALADQQDIMVDQLSIPVQKAVTILVTCYHATDKGDEATILAADLLCSDLKRELVGGEKDAKYRRKVRQLADLVIEGRFHQLDGVPAPEPMKQYEDQQ